jgi:ABC-2 type transport system ATP-binding protein
VPTAGPGERGAVEVRQIKKKYGATTALADVTFSAPPHAITAVLGRNGAGKTTTVGICTGQLRADSGTALVLGCDPRERSLRARVGVMPQPAGSGAAGVYPSARVGEVVALFASYAAHPLDVDALLERLDLRRLTRTPWRRLSGGEQQRVSLALALVGRPELVFLDEPSTGLDVHARLAVWSLLAELRDNGVTVVMTTHAMAEAERLADHLVVIDAGRVVAAGALAELAGSAQPQLRFEATAGLPVTDLQASLPAGVVVAEPSPGHYTVTGPVDTALVAAVTTWCASRDVLPQRIDTAGRSLEDVFLELTGGSA